MSLFKLERLCVFLCVVVAASIFSVALSESAVDETEVWLPDTQQIVHNGVTYELRPRVTTLMFLGVDSQNIHEQKDGLRLNSGQSDMILLCVIDDNSDTVNLLQIDRDTISCVEVLSVLGKHIGYKEAQICLAYANGFGGESSCELAKEAIEEFLRGTPIDRYFAMTYSGIPSLNDAIGGVEVTLSDDFSSLDSSMVKGAKIKLNGVQAEHFIRSRMGVGDGTNIARIARQQEYLSSAKNIILDRISASPNYVDDLFDAIEIFSVTDMTRGYLINTANKVSAYDIKPITSPKGVSLVGDDGYAEFHADEDALIETIISIWYTPVE